MDLTAPQLAVVHHRLDAHAVVRSAPGAGKTTTLVARVAHLVEAGVDPARIRVVMYNRSVKETFDARLARQGVAGVRVTTFDALGLEVLRVAERRQLLSKPLQVDVDGLTRWSREVHLAHRDRIETAEEIEAAVSFWKAHLVTPKRARFPSNTAFVEAYEQVERLRSDGDRLRVAFSDMVYTAVAVLRRHPGLLDRIDHLLVDEFQDVNPGRVELLRLLAHPATTLMAVGDEDQAINEWGGANPRFFREIPQNFPGLPVTEYRLPHSFRFGPGLAAAATKVIAHNRQRSPGDIVGAGAATRLERAGTVADAVTAALASFAPEDVAVLYRGRFEGVAALASLAAMRIPMETQDAHLLFQGKGPALALGYLRAAVEDHVDADTAWTVALGPDRYVRKEPFLTHFRERGGDGLRAVFRDTQGAEAAGQNPGAVRALRGVADLLDQMRRSDSAAGALDRLHRRIDVDETLRSRVIGERGQEIAIASYHALHALLRGGIL